MMKPLREQLGETYLLTSENMTWGFFQLYIQICIRRKTNSFNIASITRLRISKLLLLPLHQKVQEIFAQNFKIHDADLPVTYIYILPVY